MNRISRRQVLAAIALQADLPAPRGVEFVDNDRAVTGHRIDLDLDAVGDLHAWLPYFGMDAKSVMAQPYTHKEGPHAGQVSTLANAYTRVGEEWRGWRVHLNALDPVVEPEPVLDDATREQLAAIATAPAPAHRHVAGWGGVPGECGVECACGTTFDNFDTIAAAAALLDDHIAAATKAGAPC